MTIRVLLVDDDPLVRTGLRLMLGGGGGLAVVGELADGSGVVAAVRELAPDVVLMDIRMPVMDGITATRELTRELMRERADEPAAERGGARVVVLTTFDTESNVLAAMRAGAAGYLLKHTEPAEIVEAVRRAARGEPVISPSVLRKLMAHAAADSGAGELARGRLGLLTDRERQVAAAVADGLPNGEIAGRLFMSTSTVKAHISSALAKLGLNNRIQLAILAHEAGASDATGAAG